jgi:hypothetical protein
LALRASLRFSLFQALAKLASLKQRSLLTEIAAMLGSIDGIYPSH